jgi:hypothetical protein
MTQTIKRRITGCLAALAIAAVPVVGSGQTAAAASPWDTHPTKSERFLRGYVAMGDSFSSGEGTMAYDADTNSDKNKCHRSPAAYGPLLHDSSRGLRPLSFVACSSAVTQDLYQPSATNAGEAAQLDALQRRTKAVTLTIGGNDVVFSDVARACVESIRTTGFGCSTNVQLNAVIDARLAALAGTASPNSAIVPIKKILADIESASPRAKIYLAGYPELFGNTTTHFSVDQTAPSGASCVVNPVTAGRVDFADTQWINSRTRQLNAVLRTAVDQARRDKVKATYVSPSTFDDHGLCDDEAAWINPVLVNTSGIMSESLHPTAEGQSKGYVRAFQRAGF